jgi:uncharacterized protein with PIN domain
MIFSALRGETMKFIADVMLGRLAKRLRLRGFDVLYDRTLNDNEIIRLSLEQDRMILTRDTGLAARPLAKKHLLLVSADRVQEQMEQVLSRFPHEMPDTPLTRCSECNEPLDHIEREEVQDLVPHHVYERKDLFFSCPQCNRIYWHGTHVLRMAFLERKK